MSKASVVIPTRGRPDDLQMCVTSLIASNPHIAELIIVIDEHSGFGGWEDSEHMRLIRVMANVANIPVQFFHNGTPKGPAYARYVGATAAKSDVVLFLDDDVLITNKIPQGHVSDLLGLAPFVTFSILDAYQHHDDWTTELQKNDAYFGDYPRIFHRYENHFIFPTYMSSGTMFVTKDNALQYAEVYPLYSPTQRCEDLEYCLMLQRQTGRWGQFKSNIHGTHIRRDIGQFRTWVGGDARPAHLEAEYLKVKAKFDEEFKGRQIEV